jgi:hypothetical protein
MLPLLITESANAPIKTRNRGRARLTAISRPGDEKEKEHGIETQAVIGPDRTTSRKRDRICYNGGLTQGVPEGKTLGKVKGKAGTPGINP